MHVKSAELRDIFNISKRFFGKVARAWWHYITSRNALKRLIKRNDEPFLLQFVKGAVVLVFVLGVAGVFRADNPDSLLPIYATASEEVVVEKEPSGERYLAASDLFLSAQFNTAINDPSNDGEETGGAVEPQLATSQGVSLMPYSFVEVKRFPSGKRSEPITYVVKPGDTANAIAQAFDLSLNTLLWANHLSSPNLLKPGDDLVILPMDGVLYEIQRGDTLNSIALRHKSSTGEILKHNGIVSPDQIFEGQTILVPGGVKPQPAPQRIRQPAAPARQYASIQNTSGYFMRPVVGGRRTQGLHANNGVDLANGCWQAIYAAASGNVGIASGVGAWNGGFGNYVTINHPNGTRTLYAHMIRVDARPGQYVSKGQVIGMTGGRPGTFGAGRSSGCHVHFEVHGARNPF